MIIGIASGKGGTGKTTVAVNLARIGRAQLLDCDVEEPNAHLFFEETVREIETVFMPVPRIDSALCDGCGECSRFCAFHAIIGCQPSPLVFPELCHSCGGCALVCPKRAIHEEPHRIGIIERLESDGIVLIHGRLDIGVPSAAPLIRHVKTYVREDRLNLLDGPPGNSCSAVAALHNTDYVVLVTEPTPFGLNDLRIAVEMVRDLGLPLGVVVNRMGIGDERVHSFCRTEGLPILMELPEDRRIAEASARGRTIVEALPEYRAPFQSLLDKLTVKVK